MPTYDVTDVTGYSSPALPLGELSPQVTERAVQPFSNDMVIVFPLRPRCARPPLPRGEAKMLARYTDTPRMPFLCLSTESRPAAPHWRLALSINISDRSQIKKRTMTQLQSLRLQLPSDTAMSDSSGTLTQNRECQGTPNHEAMFMKSAPAQGARALSRSAFRLSVAATIVSGKRKESLRTPGSEARSAKDGERKRSF